MAETAKATRDFTTGSIPKHLIAFSTPLFLSNLLQALYNMADMVVVGQFVGKNGLSGVTIGGDILTMLTFLAMGFGNASQVIIAQHMGAGKQDRIGKIIGNIFTILLSMAILMSVVCFGFRETFLSWMQTPQESWEYALSYATVCTAGLIFIYGYNIVSAILRGMGDARHPFLFVATAALLNIALDLLFVAKFHWAATGAALATVIAQGVSFLLGLFYILTHQTELEIHLNKGCFVPDREIAGMLFKLGIPMAIKMASITFSKLFVDAWVNSYGVVASSASGIETKINSVSVLFTAAVNIGGSTMVGQNVGAEKYFRVPSILKYCFLIAVTVNAVLALLFLTVPETIFRAFTQDQDVLSACLTMVPLLMLVFVSSVSRSPGNALINGCGNYKLNFVTALLDGIINRIGFSLLFGIVLDMGWIGFLYGDAVAGFSPFLIAVPYYLSGRWKTRKYIIRE